MDSLIIFGVLSIPIILLSWRTLFKVRSHGFYRFFSWECIAWLSAFNNSFWFDNPFALNQIFSWAFLFISGYLVIIGVIQMKRTGKPKEDRNEETLLSLIDFD
jgi:hypothetical protein